jgi:hypothetical protein
MTGRLVAGGDLAQFRLDIGASVKRMRAAIAETAARRRHDPACTVPPLPTLAVAAELPDMPEALHRSAQVELMRGQNRYLAAIDAAMKLVGAATARSS